ncbi:MAG TPA: caspase family protein [Gemmataceae bacterium]|nr:caspase family protein [Gemmataceae bacterium]
MTETRITPEETWALVVAVEAYPLKPRLDLDGPFHDACRFARWLRGRGVPAGQITLLASPLGKNEAVCADLRGEGVDCRTRSPVTQEAVEEALRRFRKKSGMLVVFWSGHGIMTTDGVRRPLLGTYSDADKHTLNVDSFRQHLRSAEYGYGSEQTLIFDVCGTRFDERWHRQALPDKTFPTSPESPRCRQFVLFASEDGQAAENVTQVRTGLYYRELQTILDRPSTWPPDLDAVHRLVKERFAELRVWGEVLPSPIRYVWSSPSGDREEIDVGQASPVRPVPRRRAPLWAVAWLCVVGLAVLIALHTEHSWVWGLAALGALLFALALSRPKTLFSLRRIRISVGGQRQKVSGSGNLAVQAGHQSPVNIDVKHYHADPGREIDHAKLMLEKGNPEAAEEHLLRLKRDHWRDLTPQQRFRVQANLGFAYQGMEDNTQAARYFSLAREERPDEEEGQAFEAMAHYVAGRNADAFRLACEILDRHPKSELAAVVKIRSAPAGEPLAALVGAVHPTVADATDIATALAWRALVTGEHAAAEAFARKALARLPDHPHIKETVATAVILAEVQGVVAVGWPALAPAQQARVTEAERLLTEALAAARGASHVQRLRSLRGPARELLGRLAEAESDHVAAVECNPAEPATAARYATFLTRRDRDREAMGVLRGTLATGESAENAVMHGSLALEHGTASDRADAIAALERCRGTLGAADAEMRHDVIATLAKPWPRRTHSSDTPRNDVTDARNAPAPGCPTGGRDKCREGVLPITQ